MRIVLERRVNIGRVLNESLGAVCLLQVFEQTLAERFTIGYLAFLQADKSLDYVFGKDRVAFDLHVADTIKLAVHNRKRDAQRVVN